MFTNDNDRTFRKVPLFRALTEMVQAALYMRHEDTLFSWTA
jgi:hypothetical protein